MTDIVEWLLGAAAFEVVRRGTGYSRRPKPVSPEAWWAAEEVFLKWWGKSASRTPDPLNFWAGLRFGEGP